TRSRNTRQGRQKGRWRAPIEADMAFPEASMPFHFDQIFNQIAELIAERAARKINESAQRGMRDGARAVSALKGRRLDMRCHYPGCKDRQTGPRCRFLCEQHMTVSNGAQSVRMGSCG